MLQTGRSQPVVYSSQMYIIFMICIVHPYRIIMCGKAMPLFSRKYSGPQNENFIWYNYIQKNAKLVIFCLILNVLWTFQTFSDNLFGPLAGRNKSIYSRNRTSTCSVSRFISNERAKKHYTASDSASHTKLTEFDSARSKRIHFSMLQVYRYGNTSRNHKSTDQPRLNLYI